MGNAVKSYELDSKNNKDPLGTVQNSTNKWIETYVKRLLRLFELIVTAHPYCARESHATSCIERAR